jgi:hypothetical protein
MFAVCEKNLPQSQQYPPLLVGRLRHPKPIKFLDARYHTGNMLFAFLNMTFDYAHLPHDFASRHPRHADDAYGFSPSTRRVGVR